MKLILALLTSFFLMSTASAYNGGIVESGHRYDTTRRCHIKVIIKLERRHKTRHKAARFCHELNRLFQRGCNIRDLGYRRGWGSSFSNESTFEGRGRTYSRARQHAFSRYASFADRFGWGAKFTHSVSFSKCS